MPCFAHPPHSLRESASQQHGKNEHLIAFQSMMRRWHGRVYGHIRAKVWDDLTASEICADTWSEIWKRMPCYDPDKSVHAQWPLHWANIMLARHYARLAAARKAGPELVRLARRVSPPAEVSPALLRFSLSGDDPPHHVLAFVFCKLLEYKPLEVHTEFSRVRFHALVGIAEEEYATVVPLSASTVSLCFHRLRGRMDLPVEKVLPDQQLRNTYAELLTRITGDTTFSHYYRNPQCPGADISHWWWAHRQNLLLRIARRIGAAKSFTFVEE